MSVELHCPKCGKLIRAPDDAGGKRGKCPYCKETVYVPSPNPEHEEIPVAPLDEEEIEHERELRREAISYAAALDHETATDAGEGTGSGRRDAGSALDPGETIDVDYEVEAFVLAMRDSKLDAAERIIKKLMKARIQARDYIQGVLMDEMPRQFENVPAPLAQGFLKTLLARIG